MSYSRNSASPRVYSSSAVDYHASTKVSRPSIKSTGYESYKPMLNGDNVIASGQYSDIVGEPAIPSEASIGRDAALLTVAVAETATVTVNVLETSSKGAVRQFMSNGLKDGFVYTYVVNVTYADGEKMDSKTVKLRAGAIERLVFNQPVPVKTATAAVAPETVVIVHVPADAKVNLAGNDTNGTGLVRTFRTRQLSDGQHWANYTIRVTTKVDGVPVTKEKTIDLKAGDAHDFAFDFDAASVATR